MATASACAQGTAFTYQGHLTDGVGPANGSYDFRAALYDAAMAGHQAGVTITNPATAVSNGLFTVSLDFANQFPGANRWLEISVRTNGGDAFFTLAPRQQIMVTPYAIQAATAGSVAASNITGTVLPSSLPASPNYSGTVSAGGFSGNGAGVTALNAANLTAGTLNDARLSTNVALLNASQTFTGLNLFNNPSNLFSGFFSGDGSGLTNLDAVANGQSNVTFSSMVTITDTFGDLQDYEQHIDQQSGEPMVSFQREGAQDSYFWTSKIFQWADVGALYTNLFDADHNYEAGITCFRLNGASPYLGSGDNRGLVQLAAVYGQNGDHGAIWELLPLKAADANLQSSLFAHPLRADGYGRVMIGDIPESIHTLFVPANASLEIVGAPGDTPQLHLDSSTAFTGTWTSGDIRSDGTRLLACQQGVVMPVPQMQQTNVALSAATSFTWNFIWPFADTNYSVGMPTGSGVFSSFHLGAKTTTNVLMFFDSYTGHAEFITQHQ